MATSSGLLWSRRQRAGTSRSNATPRPCMSNTTMTGIASNVRCDASRWKRAAAAPAPNASEIRPRTGAFITALQEGATTLHMTDPVLLDEWLRLVRAEYEELLREKDAGTHGVDEI